MVLSPGTRIHKIDKKNFFAMKRGHVNILGVTRGLDVFNKYSSGGERHSTRNFQSTFQKGLLEATILCLVIDSVYKVDDEISFLCPELDTSVPT